MQQRRPMPEDFPEHANDMVVDQIARYHAGYEAIRRWRTELGLPYSRQKLSPVQQIDMETGEVIQSFESTRRAAAAVFGGSSSNIYVAARGFPLRSAYGYRWRFI